MILLIKQEVIPHVYAYQQDQLLAMMKSIAVPPPPPRASQDR